MPVGPSHSHSSGGSFHGGHSSGGFHGGTSGGFYGGPRPPIHMHWFGGRTIVLTSGTQSKLSAIFFGIFISIIVLFIGFSNFSINIKQQKIMESDAVEYAEIIKKANDGVAGYYTIEISNFSSKNYNYYNDCYHFTGDNNSTFDAYYYADKDGISYYYLEYEFTDINSNHISNCQTYAYLSQSAITGLDSIKFAYTKIYDNDGSWDCINANYTLEKNIEYSMLKSETNGYLIVGIVGIAIFGVMIFITIKVLKNIKKQQDIDNEKTMAETAQINESIKQKNRICAYCGTRISENDKKCPSCGSSKFIVKK